MTDKNKNMIHATGFSASKKLPTAKETLDKKLGFIKWGDKNDYPFYLLDMYNGSAWHQGLVKTKSYYIAGNGIKTVSGNAEDFLQNKWTDYTIDEIMKRCAFDGELFDAFCVIGTWNREGSRVIKWEYFDVDLVRTNADESLYYLSDDWSARKQTEELTNFRTIPPFDAQNKSGKFMIYYKAPSKQGKGEKGIYAKPSYVGGLTAINTDVLISQWHYYEICNGFKAGTLISMNSGVPETDEEARKVRDEIKGNTSSIEDTNQVVITFSDGQENAPSVLSLNGNDLADRYAMTEKSVQQNILVAHSITAPALFGIIKEGSFNSAESAELFEVFKNTYVSAKQNALNYVLEIMTELSGVEAVVELEEVDALKTKEEATTDTMTETFRSAKKDLEVFLKYGKKKDAFQIVKSISVRNDFKSADVEQMENDNFTIFFDKIGDIRANLNDLDKKVLHLLKKGDDGQTISKALDEPLNEVAKSYDKLKNMNLIVDGSTSSLGNNVLKGLDIDIADMEVRYSYEVKSGLGAPKIDTTRPFCETLIDANRMYTRFELDTISNNIGRDVWRYRGGYYHNPKTNVTTPWCRHEWVQHLVIKQ